MRFNPLDARFNAPSYIHTGAIEQGEEYLSGFIGGKVHLRTAYAKGNGEKFTRPMALSVLSSIRQISGPLDFSADKWSNSRPFFMAPIGLTRSWQILEPINVARCKGSCFIVDRIF